MVAMGLGAKAMASCVRIVLAPPIPLSQLTLLTQRRVSVRFSASWKCSSSPSQVPDRYSPWAGPANQIRTSAVTMHGRGPYQEGKVSSCKSFNEQVATALSTVVVIAATALVAVNLVNVERADAVQSLGLEAGAVFQRTCAGCHSGGGNILQPSATLFRKDLEKNGLVRVDDIYNVTYFGKNRMPGYGEKCTPRGQCTFGPRLSEEDIRALADFVRMQADQGWANVPS